MQVPGGMARLTAMAARPAFGVMHAACTRHAAAASFKPHPRGAERAHTSPDDGVCSLHHVEGGVVLLRGQEHAHLQAQGRAQPARQGATSYAAARPRTFLKDTKTSSRAKGPCVDPKVTNPQH